MVDSAFSFDVEGVLEESPLPSESHIVIRIDFHVSSETIGLTFDHATLKHLLKLEFAINKGCWIFRVSLGESKKSCVAVDQG